MFNTQHKKRYFLQTALALALGCTAYQAAAEKPAATSKQAAQNLRVAAVAAATAPTTAATAIKAPFSPELIKWLAENKIKGVLLVNENSEVQVLSAEGVSVPTCGESTGTLTPRTCELDKISPTSSNSINLTGFTPPAAAQALNSTGAAVVNDPCTSINMGGAWWKYCW
ncbi:MAG: hypothetical protein ACKN9T_06400 [Candidatus Methylumidiphilus sp.]